eukprot:701486-Rhodomonas_salina.1
MVLVGAALRAAETVAAVAGWEAHGGGDERSDPNRPRNAAQHRPPLLGLPPPGPLCHLTLPIKRAHPCFSAIAHVPFLPGRFCSSRATRAA